ncbi:CDP-2,3-bis-(O-geranylgeranyl)-sn-glycerol synthase [Candidatus Parvarchaeota archaeon]|nr:CDP-2,3-bis-(O-geranylgeranyl)-sn-glycerol synthase [Candidatus Parvarchaeota archaeon]
MGILLFIMPAYFANSVPVVLGFGAPIDFGRNFVDGKRLFGDGKTIRGFVAGILAGTLIGLLQAVFLPETQFALYNNAQGHALAGFLLSSGTMLGDLAGSFFKRRLGYKRGQPSFLLDQLFFLLVALALVFPFAPKFVLDAPNLAFLFAFTYFMHVASNYAANRLGLKKVPW